MRDDTGFGRGTAWGNVGPNLFLSFSRSLSLLRCLPFSVFPYPYPLRLRFARFRPSAQIHSRSTLSGVTATGSAEDDTSVPGNIDFATDAGS
jgi:hypothetical protein